MTQVNLTVLFSWLNCITADIVCLQETHSLSSDEFDVWLKSETDYGNNSQRYSILSSSGSARSRGVAILFKPCFSVVSHSADDPGHLQVVTFSKDGFDFQVICIYGPNRQVEGAPFFADLFPYADTSFPLFLAGDFNTVVDASIARRGCNVFSLWAYNWPRSLEVLATQLDVQDAWRSKHPTAREYTWRRVNGAQASSLDMFWISSSLIDRVIDVGVFPFFRSDHSYVYLSLKLPSAPERDPGIWKFNTSLLSDETFSIRVRDF